MTQLTPEALREVAAKPAFAQVLIDQAEAALLADAIEIADSSARCDIECNLTPVGDYTPGQGFRWWDESTADDASKEPLEQAVRYLTARGLLERHPEHAHWISPRSPA